MDLGIKGRKALVTAASKGLGRGCAMALAREGVQVTITARDPKALQQAAEAIKRETGGIVVAVPGDIATEAGRRAALEACPEPDILVTNAGGPPPGRFSSTDLDGYQAALDMNLLSMIEMCRVAIPPMRERHWGRVCAITSIGVKQPLGTLMASSVARAGYTSFLKITAREVAADGVCVNSCLPGTHYTDRLAKLIPDEATAAAQVPAKITGDPYHFGQAVAFLCSEPARFITGTGLLLDGGASSGLLD